MEIDDIRRWHEYEIKEVILLSLHGYQSLFRVKKASDIHEACSSIFGQSDDIPTKKCFDIIQKNV